MVYEVNSNLVSKDEIILLCTNALKLYNLRLMGHCERVTYIAFVINAHLGDFKLDEKILLPLCLFHDIGFFKAGDSIDSLFEVEKNHAVEHTIYGYLFTKYFTPLSNAAQAILYHHTDYPLAKNKPYSEYSSMIMLADRIDVALENGYDEDKLFEYISDERFNSIYVTAFKNALKQVPVLENLKTGAFNKTVADHVATLPISTSDALDYIRMLVFCIDFKSEFTVLHSMHTMAAALCICDLLKLPKQATDNMFYAALIHDIGKLAIPAEILEFPGRFSPEQMNIMKSHAVFTTEIIKMVLPSDICLIAGRHHERLDGSGYPFGLTADELSQSDRILAVADIFSALIEKRSYKDNYDKQTTINILTDMASNNFIDSDIVKLVADNFAHILQYAEDYAIPVMNIHESINAEYPILYEDLKNI